MQSNQESLDIVALVENNPLNVLSSYNYGSRIIEKIKERFTNEEEQLFIANFYCYLNYDIHKDFIVDLEKLWGWIGFNRINDAKRLLVNNFVENKDYTIENCVFLTGAGVDGKNLGGSGKNKETIMLTVYCFKKLCLKAKTKKSNKIHDYYLSLEELMMELVLEQSKELADKLSRYTNNTIIDINDYAYKPMVYLIDLNTLFDGQKLYRIGISRDFIERFRTHSGKLKQEYDYDITFKNGWNCVHYDVAIDVEIQIKRYIKSQKLLTKHKYSPLEIFKTNDIGFIEKLIDKWHEECTEKYNMKHKVSHQIVINDKLSAETEYMKQLNLLIDKGVPIDKLILIKEIVPTEQPKPAPTVEKKKDIRKKEVVEDGVKCGRCGHIKNPKDYDTDKDTGRLLTLCKECCTLMRNIKLEEGREEREKEERDYNKKQNEIQELRNVLLNGTIKIKCCGKCKEHKLPIEFGIYKRTNTLYKKCISCRPVKETKEYDEDVVLRECSKCYEDFPFSIDEITLKSHRRCKECRDKGKVHDKKKNIVHKEKISVQKSENHIKNKEKHNEKDKKHHENHKFSIGERKKKNKENNKEAK